MPDKKPWHALTSLSRGGTNSAIIMASLLLQSPPPLPGMQKPCIPIVRTGLDTGRTRELLVADGSRGLPWVGLWAEVFAMHRPVGCRIGVAKPVELGVSGGKVNGRRY